jgi:hypothetical protein
MEILMPRLGLRWTLAALFAAPLAGCGEIEHHKLPPSPPFDVWEVESNDSECCPNWLGWVSVGNAFVVGGNIRDDVQDLYDGFRLQTALPCRIRFWLEPLDGVSDLDLCVWDPIQGQYAFCFETSDPVEYGEFNVPFGDYVFDLVVNSYSGDSEYRLYVNCDPIIFGLNATAAPAEDAKVARQHTYGEPREALEVEREERALPAWIVQVNPGSGEVEVHEAAWRRISAGPRKVDGRREEGLHGDVQGL